MATQNPEVRRQIRTRFYNKRQAMGICPKHPGEPILPDMTICAKCRESNSSNYQKRYADPVKKAEILADNATWIKSNPIRMKELNNRWYQENKERKHKRRMERLKTNIQARLRHRLRGRLLNALKGSGIKVGSAVRDLGCLIPELKSLLEALWEPGMTWENWGNGPGRWNIDHIRPLASFDLTKPEQVRIACHFTNLQPLWWSLNMSKGSK